MARNGKSIREHFLTIRTIKELAKKENVDVSAVYFDIKKCFDKMVLKEAMKELWLKGHTRKALETDMSVISALTIDSLTRILDKC